MVPADTPPEIRFWQAYLLFVRSRLLWNRLIETITTVCGSPLSSHGLSDYTPPTSGCGATRMTSADTPTHQIHSAITPIICKLMRADGCCFAGCETTKQTS